MEVGRVVNSNDHVNEVEVCNVCGHAGFDNCLARCSRCSEGAQHTYCMATIFDVVPARWVCEGCTLRQKDAVNKKRPLHVEVQLGQAHKKRILSRVISSPLPRSACKDAVLLRSLSLKRSPYESKADPPVFMQQVDKGSSGSQVQPKVGASLKETVQAKTDQHTNSITCRLEAGKAASSSKGVSDFKDRLPFMSIKTICNVSNLQKEAVVALDIKSLQSKVEPAQAVLTKGTSPIKQFEERNIMNFGSSSKPREGEVPPLGPEKQEPGKPAAITSSKRETLSPPTANTQRDLGKGAASVGTRLLLTPSIIAPSVIETVGGEGVLNNMGSSAEKPVLSPQCAQSNLAEVIGRPKNYAVKKRIIVRDFPIITQKIKILGETSVNLPSIQKGQLQGEVTTPSDAKRLLMLGVGKATGNGQVTEEAVKGIDGPTMLLDLSQEWNTGQLTRDGGSMKDIAIGKEAKGIDGFTMPIDMLSGLETRQLTRDGSSMKENTIRLEYEDSCKMSKAKGELEPPPSVGGKAQDRNGMKEGRPTGSSSCLIEISTNAGLTEAAPMSTAATHHESVAERNAECVDLSNCAMRESPVIVAPRQELEVHKKTSSAGTNKIARAFLRRITGRDFPSPKSRSMNLGKSTIPTDKEVTGIAGQNVTAQQDNRQVKSNGSLEHLKKVAKRDFPIVPLKTPTKNLEQSTSSIATRSHEIPSTQMLQVEDTFVKLPSPLGKDTEAAQRISQAEEEGCRSGKVERALSLLHQITPTNNSRNCNNKQDCTARMSMSCVMEEPPGNNVSKAVIEPASMMGTTAIHFKGVSQERTFEETGKFSVPSDSKFPDGAAATFESTRGHADGAGFRVRSTLEDTSMAKAAEKQASERLPPSNTKVSNGRFSSSMNGERVNGAVPHHLLKQKKGGTEATMPLSARVERSFSHVSVSEGAMKDVPNGQSNKEATARISTRLGQADQNHGDKVSSRVNLSPGRRVLGVRLADNRSVRKVAADDQPANRVPRVKEPPRKKVRFAVDEAHDLSRDRLQSSSFMKEDHMKNSFYRRHGNVTGELPNYMEKPSSSKLRQSLSSGLEFDFRNHHSENSRCQVRNTSFYKGANRCRTCGEVGHPTEFCKTRQREWRENDSPSFNEAYRCGRCDEVGHSAEFCEAGSMDKRREWGRKDSPDLNDKQRGWRRTDSTDSTDFKDKQREWRRKGPADPISKQREWRKNESPDYVEKFRDWRRKDASNLHEKEREWRKDSPYEKEREWRKDSPNMYEKERERRRKESLKFIENQRDWRRDGSFDLSDGDSPEKSADTRYVKRPAPGFQGSDGSERWRYDRRKEKSSSSMWRLDSNLTDSVRLCSKRSLKVYDGPQLDEEHSQQWQLREEAGFERESLGLERLDSAKPSKVSNIDMQPISKQVENAVSHQRQIARVQAQNTCVAPPLQGPSSSYFGQARWPLPSSQVLWTGFFNLSSKKGWSTCYKGMQAHPSTEADPKVCEALLTLPFKLEVEEVKRGEGNGSWPRAFQQCLPTSQSIGIYFTPKDMESDDAWYQPLVHHLNAHDFVLKSEMDFIKLLIFPSHLLPEPEQRWDGRFFLWGIFTRNKSKQFIELSRPPSERDRGSDLGSPEGNGEVIDMDIDMVGGREAVLLEWQDLGPPLPPGFAPPPPPLPRS